MNKRMSLDDNIFFVKSKLVDNIYKSAKLERMNVTFEDVFNFINNKDVNNISNLDLAKLKGLRDAWSLVLNTITEDLTIDYIKKVHFQVCKGQSVMPLGEFRDTGVGITGTNWRPKLPEECDYEEELKNILNIEDDLDRCLELFCWIQRSQMFKDGNKRVANLVANKEMIKNGLGIIAIPVERIGDYTTKLINYYENNDATDLKNWLKEYALDSLYLTPEKDSDVDDSSNKLNDDYEK